MDEIRNLAIKRKGAEIGTDRGGGGGGVAIRGVFPQN